MNPKYYQNELQSLLTTFFWLNAGDRNIVPGPFMILFKGQYSNNWLFLIVDLNEILEYSDNWLLSNWSRLLN